MKAGQANVESASPFSDDDSEWPIDADMDMTFA